MQLPRAPGEGDRFAGPLAQPFSGGWYLVVLRAGRQRPGWMATMRLRLADGGPPQDIALVWPFAWDALGCKSGVFYIRPGTAQAAAQLYGAQHALPRLGVWMLPLPRLLAALGVFLQNPAVFRTAWRAVSGSPGDRVRKAASAAGQGGQRLPSSYASWLRLFDSWPPARIEAARRGGAPSIAALVFHAGDGPPLEATLAALAAQIVRPVTTVTAGPGDAGAPGRAAEAADYVAVLQAGEVPPPHALLMLAGALGGQPDIVFADEDRVDLDGTRRDPLFKPQPSLTMMCSGLLSRGIWLVRAALIEPAAWAETLRLQAWFRSHRAGGASLRVPYLLTQRRDDAEAASPEALAEAVNAGLHRAGIEASVAPGFPLRLRWRIGEASRRRVSIIVPSRLRNAVTVSCMQDVLDRTTHPDFEMLVVVTQDGPLDAAQLDVAQRLQGDKRVHVLTLRRESFNYSAANNHGAAHATGALLCLLNDDVSTVSGDWLERMGAILSDPATGIVGAKLYYPNMLTQHGGVIMGLAGLAQHASRFLPRGEPGYAWRGVLDQELSVVTGACLLVRRDLYQRLGGMDESYPTAFNDVDFCLRARELGFGVVFAGSVELVHHETLSFGHHYAAALEQEERDVRRMRARWGPVCADDPFHNPNLSLAAQAEWQVAYPPRTAGLGAAQPELPLRVAP